MKPKVEQNKLKEIADQLECGYRCYLQKDSLDIISFPEQIVQELDNEKWAEQVEKVKQNPQVYLEIRPMTTTEQLRMMEDFVYTLKDQELGKRLAYVLSRPNPLLNFKQEIDYSEYRQYWFDYKTRYIQDWLSTQIRIGLG